MACGAIWPGFLLLVIVVELYRPSMLILISSHLLSRLVFIYFINATLDAISFVFMSVIVLETMYDVLCMLLLHGGGISIFANSTSSRNADWSILETNSEAHISHVICWISKCSTSGDSTGYFGPRTPRCHGDDLICELVYRTGD